MRYGNLRRALRFVLPAVGVCCLLPLLALRAREVVDVRYHWKDVKSITVSGHVRWEGDLTDKTARIVFEGFPTSAAFAGPGELTLYLSQGTARGEAYELAYDLREVAVERAGTETRTHWRRGKGTSTRVRELPVSKADYHLIRLEPPPGWTAKPEEVKVAESTDDVDFVLKPSGE